MPLIHFEKVSRVYHLGETAIEALKEVDLKIGRGEFVAVWGPSGSGKSTLCNLMGMLDTATSGRVLVNDKDVQQLTDDQRSDHRNYSVGFVFQQFNLIKVLTALENIMLPLNLSGKSVAESRDRAMRMLKEVGIEEYANHRPDKLSGGQQQRVAIARSLAGEPPMVIADEPTANLDTENAERIVGLMRKFNETHGTTFIFSTHDQRLLDQVNRRIKLEDGRLGEDTGSGAVI